MKEVKLSEIDYNEIKSKAHDNWINYYSGENAVVKSIVDSFISFCKSNNYIIKDGKVHQTDEKV